MLEGIQSNNIQEVRRLLDSGEDVNTCQVNRRTGREPVDTLRLCYSVWNQHPEIAKLLIERGARLTSQKSKEGFDSSIDFMVDYGMGHEGYQFARYMPVLRVFAEYGFISPQLIKKLAAHAPDSNQVEKELLSLSLSLKKKSQAEIKKNSALLFQAGKSERCLLGNLPDDLRIAISALTANPLAHTYEQAHKLGLTSFQEFAAARKKIDDAKGSEPATKRLKGAHAKLESNKDFMPSRFLDDYDSRVATPVETDDDIDAAPSRICFFAKRNVKRKVTGEIPEGKIGSIKRKPLT